MTTSIILATPPCFSKDLNRPTLVTIGVFSGFSCVTMAATDVCSNSSSASYYSFTMMDLVSLRSVSKVVPGILSSSNMFLISNLCIFSGEIVSPARLISETRSLIVNYEGRLYKGCWVVYFMGEQGTLYLLSMIEGL